MAPAGRSRLVVFGDADFASNEYFSQQANGELLIGNINWLAENRSTMDEDIYENGVCIEKCEGDKTK